MNQTKSIQRNEPIEIVGSIPSRRVVSMKDKPTNFEFMVVLDRLGEMA